MDWHAGQYSTGEIQMHESSNWLVLYSSTNNFFLSFSTTNIDILTIFSIAECARSACGVATKDAIAIVRDWFLNAKK